MDEIVVRGVAEVRDVGFMEGEHGVVFRLDGKTLKVTGLTQNEAVSLAKRLYTKLNFEIRISNAHSAGGSQNG